MVVVDSQFRLFAQSRAIPSFVNRDSACKQKITIRESAPDSFGDKQLRQAALQMFWQFTRRLGRADGLAEGTEYQTSPCVPGSYRALQPASMLPYSSRSPGLRPDSPPRLTKFIRSTTYFYTKGILFTTYATLRSDARQVDRRLVGTRLRWSDRAEWEK
jgi:hypothetical protein